MKRKRVSRKGKPNKPSGTGAADISADPGYYSDINEGIGEKEPKSSRLDTVYSKQELDAALSVIKKIMVMDAAGPFNAPVDPDALGLPDYLDIIDTPMDFGTICSKLENGVKYRNSEEVFKDVQLIWDNCCKYNTKGSYILELMKRVKNNFMKRWTAAGLYKKQQTVRNGHLHHNPRLLDEPTMRNEEAVHMSPVGYLQQDDWRLSNQGQRQYLSPCCSHTSEPQQASYQCKCSLHSGHSQPGQHQHGNLNIQPPIECAANCTKPGTECPHPRTDNTSRKELNQINSTPDRSSSVINVEACQSFRNTCHMQPESSPSDRLQSTAGMLNVERNFPRFSCFIRVLFSLLAIDDNVLKRKTRGEGLNLCQEQLRIQTGSPESQPSPTSSDYNRKLKGKSSQDQGPNMGFVLKEGERIRITTNGQGQPVGPHAQKLVSFLGTLARNGHFLPLTYLDWTAVPSENKENMWEKVQLMFDIDPGCKKWVLQSLRLKWKAWKSQLKIAHYNPHETDVERLADRDERVLPDQWAALIKLWNTETAQKFSARNRANRMKHKYIHATGRKSFAVLCEELRAKRPDGKEPSREELFILTRTRKNGKPVNEASSEVITQLRQRANGQDATPQDSNKQGDILSQIIGSDKQGRTRCIKLGPSPSAIEGQEPTHGEAIQLVSEANAEISKMKEKMAVMEQTIQLLSEGNADICKMREKMEVMEQTCAAMASQMAAMMSMMSSMQSNTPDQNVPDKTRRSKRLLNVKNSQSRLCQPEVNE